MKEKLPYLNYLLKQFNLFILTSTINELKLPIKLDDLNYELIETKINNVDEGILNLTGYSVLTNDKNLSRKLKQKYIKVYKLSASKYIRC